MVQVVICEGVQIRQPDIQGAQTCPEVKVDPNKQRLQYPKPLIVLAIAQF